MLGIHQNGGSTILACERRDRLRWSKAASRVDCTCVLPIQEEILELPGGRKQALFFLFFFWKLLACALNKSFAISVYIGNGKDFWRLNHLVEGDCSRSWQSWWVFCAESQSCHIQPPCKGASGCIQTRCRWIFGGLLHCHLLIRKHFGAENMNHLIAATQLVH